MSFSLVPGAIHVLLVSSQRTVNDSFVNMTTGRSTAPVPHKPE